MRPVLRTGAGNSGLIEERPPTLSVSSLPLVVRSGHDYAVAASGVEQQRRPLLSNP
jgi:hypothetical protein